MATTADNHLSNYDLSAVPDGSEMKICIVVSEWNSDITNGLLNGANESLLRHKVSSNNITIIWVPGSYELPFGAQLALETTKYDAVICLGCVIRGETSHFDYVCQACALGIKDVSLKYNKPVIFGVLTDDNKQQSIDRSGGKLGNKGIESAITALKLVKLQRETNTN